MAKEKNDIIVRTRISQEDYDILKGICNMLELTPSKYIRMLLKNTILPVKQKINAGEFDITLFKLYEDSESGCNDQL